jgi:hypothetical protein
LVAERADEVVGLDLGQALSFVPGVVVSAGARRALLFGASPLRTDVLELVGTPTIGAVVGPLRILDEQQTLLAIGTRGSDHPRDPLRVCDSFRLFVDAGVGGTIAASASRNER